MVRMIRACIQSLLKFVNSGNGLVGIAMILYGIWLMRAWQRHLGHFPFERPDDPIPWYCLLALLQTLQSGISFYFLGLFLFLVMLCRGQTEYWNPSISLLI